MLMDGRAQATGIKRPSMDATVLLVLNAYHDVVKFTLPEVVGGQTWRCLLDTNVPDRTGTPRFQSGEEYEVTGRSLLLFALQPDSAQSVALTRAREALRQVAETPVQSATCRRAGASDVGSAETAGSAAGRARSGCTGADRGSAAADPGAAAIRRPNRCAPIRV